jgi:protease I
MEKMTDLNDLKVAFLATNEFEDSELTSPWHALSEAGAQVHLVSPISGSILGAHGHEQRVDLTVQDAAAADYDALVLPGGVGNADKLRMDRAATEFAKAFFEQHKPVGVICHGGWILVEADVVNGRTITSYPSLRTDLENAGANWIDQEVVVDQGLVSSRTPDDLPAFNQKLIEEFREGPHPGQTA